MSAWRTALSWRPLVGSSVVLIPSRYESRTRAARVQKNGGWARSAPARRDVGGRLHLGHGEERAVVAAEDVACILRIERTGAAAAEDGELVSALVDGAIAVEAARDRDRRTARRICRDETVLRQI